MRRVLYLIVPFFLGVFNSYSQNCVSGYVYTDNDTDSLVALTRVKVILESNNNKRVVKTDNNGFYSIELGAVADTVYVSFLKKNYGSIEVEFLTDLLKGKKRIDILLRRYYSLHDSEYKGSSEILLNK